MLQTSLIYALIIFLCIVVFSRENMYQDHLHKITDDSEKQRLKRDQLIESLKKNMSTADAELKKTRLKQETDRYLSLVRNNHSLSCASFFCYLMYVRFKRHIYQLVLPTKKRMCSDSLALYSLASVCIFSILLPRHFLGSDKENLFNNQELLQLVITFFILMTLMFDLGVVW